MEIGLREWLILIGIVVIVVILFDGWRRMQSSKGKLKIQLDPNAGQGNLEEDDSHPEVLGPARVVTTRQSAAPLREREPTLDDDLPSISARDDLRNPQLSPEPLQAAEDERDLDLTDSAPPMEPAPRRKPHTADNKASKAPAAPLEEVLVINVISREPQGFRGTALLQNILESGLRFGDMNIFHRHESMTGNGEILFSMANAVKPGTFNLDEIDRFTTPAVSFFLGLPGPRHPKTAFDLMLAAARKLSEELNGELKDDQRSVLTAQTIEHYRQRMAEFERRQMTLSKR